VCLASPSRVGARALLKVTAPLDPVVQAVGEALGGFVGTARALFHSTPGAPTAPELSNVGLDAAGG
jgi:hypothetical protein